MRRLFLTIICAFVSLTLLAQSANLMSMARGELARRGLAETEVRARLLQNGIDVDNIPPSEYAAYQDRVIAILNQMQEEKAAQANNAAVATGEVLSMEIAETTESEAFAEEENEKKLEQAKEVAPSPDDIYGHGIFAGQSLDVFRTTDGAQAPDTYVLGEGDEVHVSIFGSSQTDIHQRIGEDGSIHPAGASRIFLKGMTLAQAREAVRKALASYYSFRADQIAVTITTARTVSVSLYGEVKLQGGYTVSALNNAFNVLAAAGGPTEIGSVRNIQRTRAGKTARLDLYTYMTAPNSGVQYDLQNNDVLFIPVAQKVVKIEGAVYRPMRYEMVEGETLVDLIGFAGGLTDNAYREFVQVERFIGGEKKYLEFNLENVMSGAQLVPLQAGDVVRIKTASGLLDQYVRVQGDVYYDGDFDLEKNRSLRNVLESAKPRYTARTDYVFVERSRTDETVEILTVPFPGVNGNPDFLLQERDVVRVLSKTDYRDVATIAVSGHVREPFSRPFAVNDKMTVQEALEFAGGVKPGIAPVGYIFRTDIYQPGKTEYIPVNLTTDLKMPLQAGDLLNVYDSSLYTNIGEVRISGAVKNPVGVAFDASLNLHDLIMMAGGFEVGAAYNRVEVFRVNISQTETVQYDQLTLSVDDSYNLVDGDFQLQPYDHVIVRMTPAFGLSRTVEINGRVRYPGVYVLEDGRTQLSDILKLAGGMLDDADPYVTLFRTYNNRGPISLNLEQVRMNGRTINSNPILMEGDVINVVRQENTVTIRETGTRMAQYVADQYPSTQKSVVYQGSHSAAWYIRHYAGGFDKLADRMSVTVTMPNNQTESTTKFLFFNVYPKVEPGSVIALRLDPEKERKAMQPKEKVDWDAMYGRLLTTVTSVSTIILLIERMSNK